MDERLARCVAPTRCSTDADPGLWGPCVVAANSHGQIHTDYRSPVEKKGRYGHSLSEREGPDPCLDGFLLLFWVHYIKDGPHLLRTGSL